MTLDTLDALARKAAPGPWRWPVGGNLMDAQGYKVLDLPCGLPEDLAYIAALSPSVWLALIAELRALRTVAEAAGQAVDAAGGHNWPVNCDRLRMALEAWTAAK